MASVEDKVKSLVQPIIEQNGYELYDVEFTKEGKDYFLRIYIQNDNGIGITDCEKVTHAINDILDEADLIKNEYFLEVSSTGVERVIRKDEHLQKALGEEIQINLFKSINKEKSICGKLLKFNSKIITIKTDEGELDIERIQIAQIKTKYNW